MTGLDLTWLHFIWPSEIKNLIWSYLVSLRLLPSNTNTTLFPDSCSFPPRLVSLLKKIIHGLRLSIIRCFSRFHGDRDTQLETQGLSLARPPPLPPLSLSSDSLFPGCGNSQWSANLSVAVIGWIVVDVVRVGHSSTSFPLRLQTVSVLADLLGKLGDSTIESLANNNKYYVKTIFHPRKENEQPPHYFKPYSWWWWWWW